MPKEILNEASTVIAKCIEGLKVVQARQQIRFEYECIGEIASDLEVVLDKICGGVKC